MKFAYPAEKLAAARRSLMLPPPEIEADAIAGAFAECDLGLHGLCDDDLDVNARDWIAKLRELMDTSGLADPSFRGLWSVRASGLTQNQKTELARIVDELAAWFDARFRTELSEGGGH